MEGLVRCVECETDPLTPEQFCECCGRKLPAPESATPGVQLLPFEPVLETSADTAADQPCESCGGPSSNGPLCASCQSAFQSVIDGSSVSSAPQSVPNPVES